jgi:hypothetical protein
VDGLWGKMRKEGNSSTLDEFVDVYFEAERYFLQN